MSESTTADEKGFNIDWLLEAPASLGRNFDAALAKIYAFRSLLSLTLPKNAVVKDNDIDVSGTRPHTVLIFNRQDVFFDVDLKSIAELVKEKHLDGIPIFGGIPRIASAVKSDVGGLDGSEQTILGQRQEFGSNTYEKPPSRSFFRFVVDGFADLIILILLGCAALSLAFGIKEHGLKEGWYDGGSIFVSVFLVIAVSSVSNYSKYRQFNELSEVSDNIQVEVVRSGRRQLISIFEIVVGDVICLKIGDQVPADGLFLDGHSLQIDESSMTGESHHEEVNGGQNPFLISGTKVVDGNARMIATAVGMNTKWGQMMSSISRDFDERTPLQARLDKLTSSIGKVGLAVALLVLVVLLVRYFTGNTTDENGNREFNGSKTKADDVVNAVVGIVAAAVSIILVAIPEGLPSAVTLTLAYSVRKMIADRVMLRNLSACETMGFATVICTNKTGTLTLNHMVVVEFWLGQRPVEKGTAAASISPRVIELIQQGVALNTTGSVYRPDSGDQFEFSGSPTEKAILSWAVQEFDMDMEEMKQSCDILQVEAFNSRKKRSGVMMRKKTDNTVHVHWKGAPEMILAKCSTYYDSVGNMRDLDDDAKETFYRMILGMAARSLRCIAFAHKQLQEEERQDGKEESLTLIGLVGMKDPCRPGVRDAVCHSQSAGVSIKMITADNVFTAKAIATECGILHPAMDLSGAVIEGEEFRNYTPEQRMEKVDKICVMARSSPSDKLLMAQCLKQKGHVVAVTGDGTSDAPALKDADIGLSMGIHGTEVAKESSDVVIMDDNFASMVNFLRWGRCAYNNIQKLIQFQLTVNVAAPVINLVAAISSGEVPLTVVQLLWVSLIVDTLAALALATEPPTDAVMVKPPVCRTEPLITNLMWRNLLAQASYQIAVLLTIYFRGESIFGVNEKVKDTLIFNTFVLCQVFNEFNARKLEEQNVFKGILRNRLFLGIILITTAFQVMMVQLLNKFANTEMLNWGQWGVCIVIAAVSWPVGWVVKYIPVPDKPFFSYLNWKRLRTRH